MLWYRNVDRYDGTKQPGGIFLSQLQRPKKENEKKMDVAAERIPSVWYSVGLSMQSRLRQPRDKPHDYWHRRILWTGIKTPAHVMTTPSARSSASERNGVRSNFACKTPGTSTHIDFRRALVRDWETTERTENAEMLTITQNTGCHNIASGPECETVLFLCSLRTSLFRCMCLSCCFTTAPAFRHTISGRSYCFGTPWRLWDNNGLTEFQVSARYF